MPSGGNAGLVIVIFSTGTSLANPKGGVIAKAIQTRNSAETFFTASPPVCKLQAMLLTVTRSR